MTSVVAAVASSAETAVAIDTSGSTTVTSAPAAAVYSDLMSQCIGLQATCVEILTANGSWTCEMCNKTQRAVCEMIAGNKMI
jgi:hypothetical protein